MSRLLLFFLTIQLALTPIGLCPCWLIVDLEHGHPHFGIDRHQPHSHQYLFELADAALIATVPHILPAHAFLAWLTHHALLFHKGHDTFLKQRWSLAPIPPPPRLA